MKRRRKKSNGGAPENVTKALRRRSRVKRQTADGRGKTAPRRAAETVTLEGVFAATERGFGFVTVTEESPLTEDIFIPARKRGGAMAGDRVTVAVRKRDLRPTAGGDFRIEGEITGILSRGFNELCGTLVETEGAERRFAPYRVIPDNLRLADAVEIASAADAAPGDKVLVRITDYGDNRRPPRGAILRSLGASLSLGANYESVLLAAGIRTEFPDEVLRDAERAAAEPISPAGRLDLRDAAILTIDGADAKDLDDAISLEKTADGWLLGVHIADVSHYVREGSPTDKEAIARGTCVYFTDKVVPMLPECRSNGVSARGSPWTSRAGSMTAAWKIRSSVPRCAACTARSTTSLKRRANRSSTQNTSLSTKCSATCTRSISCWQQIRPHAAYLSWKAPRRRSSSMTPACRWTSSSANAATRRK